MPSTRRHSYDLNFKLKIVAEAEAVSNNHEIAREYGISESMVRKWRHRQYVLFDKQSFTVVLAVKADGEKLPPKVIFKGIRQLRIKVLRRMQFSVYKNAWMDAEGLFFFLYRFRSI